jgi:DNA-binding transcriptional regulator YiaG
MCKHVAATLYGVGARLDEKPELLFLLRGVDHLELIAAEASSAAFLDKDRKSRSKTIDDGDLGDIFGIDLLAIESPSETRRQSKSDREDTGAARTKRIDGRTIVNSGANAKTAPSVRVVNKTSKAGADKTSKTASSATLHSSASARPEAAPLYSGEDVRALRAKLDMSQSQLAALIGVSAASISNWEKEYNLRARAVEVLKPVMKLSKRQAWNQLQRK